MLSRCSFLVTLFTFFSIIIHNTLAELASELQYSRPSMALVPYSKPSTLGILHISERNFSFAGKTLNIYQDWEEGGVAAVVWDAAIVLGRYLESQGNWIKEKKVIELGAGTGLVGMVAALLGGKVVVTDRQVALNYTTLNVENNSKALLKTSLNVAKLDWGQDITNFSAPYDVILGADIIYIEDTFQDLFKTLMDLSGDDSVILLSCRIRYERDNKFIHFLKTRFNVRKVFYDRSLNIYIYKARKLESMNVKYEL